MNQKLSEELLGNVLDIGATLYWAVITFIKASPWLLLIWILFIAPNC